MYVVAQLVALAIAEHGNVGQQQCAILRQAFRFKAVFVDEVEGEAALEQCIVDALCRLVHVGPGWCRSRAWVKKLGALPYHHSDVGDGTTRRQMRIVAGSPAEIVGADLLPATVFDKSVLRTDEMKVGHHAAGKGLVEPHIGFGRILRNVSPSRSAGRVSGCDVGRDLAIEHGIANTTLQAASPDGCVLIRTALIVSLEPCGNLAEAIEIGSTAYIAARVGEEEAVGPF